MVEALARGRPSAPAQGGPHPGAAPARSGSSRPAGARRASRTTPAYASYACAPTDWRNTMPSDDTTTTDKTTDLAAALQAAWVCGASPRSSTTLVARATKARWSVVQILGELGRLEAQERARKSCERRLSRSKPRTLQGDGGLRLELAQEDRPSGGRARDVARLPRARGERRARGAAGRGQDDDRQEPRARHGARRPELLPLLSRRPICFWT